MRGRGVCLTGNPIRVSSIEHSLQQAARMSIRRGSHGCTPLSGAAAAAATDPRPYPSSHLPALPSLALSLHAPTQELRQTIVPSAKAFKLDRQVLKLQWLGRNIRCALAELSTCTDPADAECENTVPKPATHKPCLGPISPAG